MQISGLVESIFLGFLASLNMGWPSGKNNGVKNRSFISFITFLTSWAQNTVDVLERPWFVSIEHFSRDPVSDWGLLGEYEIISQSPNRWPFPLKGHLYSMGTESSAIFPILWCLEKRPPPIPWCERPGSNKVHSEWSIHKGILFFGVIM